VLHLKVYSLELKQRKWQNCIVGKSPTYSFTFEINITSKDILYENWNLLAKKFPPEHEDSIHPQQELERNEYKSSIEYSRKCLLAEYFVTVIPSANIVCCFLIERKFFFVFLRNS
jgi:hypothetical protein